MKRKYSIGLLLFILIILTIAFSLYKTEKEVPLQIEEDYHTNLVDNSFYLYESNGYIVVYKNDALYEFTDIRYNDLPEQLQLEIKNGKQLENVDELYGFLENYTS